MFTNLTIYRISENWKPDWTQLDQALGKQQFSECGPTQEKSVGWVPPRGGDDITDYEEAVDCCLIKYGATHWQRECVARALNHGATWMEALTAHLPHLMQ